MRQPSLLLLLLLLACQPKDPPVVDPTTGPTESMGDTTTGDVTTGAILGSTTDVTTQDPSTTGAVLPDAAEICEQFCGRLVACDLDGSFDGCPCYPEFLAPFCVDEWRDVAVCFEEATCADLGSGDSPCWMMYEHAYSKCEYGEDGCEIFAVVGGGPLPPPGACRLAKECLDIPTEELDCDVDTCTCMIDGAIVGTCPNSDKCEGDDPAVYSKFDACCG